MVESYSRMKSLSEHREIVRRKYEGHEPEDRDTG
jgi:hypothetical protein